VDEQAPLTLPERVLGDIGKWADRLSVPLPPVVPNDRW